MDANVIAGIMNVPNVKKVSYDKCVIIEFEQVDPKEEFIDEFLNNLATVVAWVDGTLMAEYISLYTANYSINNNIVAFSGWVYDEPPHILWSEQ